jgi:hypothetical protein
MIDPATIAASAIAKLAFDEFIKSGAVEAAKKTVGSAVELVKASGPILSLALSSNKNSQIDEPLVNCTEPNPRAFPLSLARINRRGYDAFLSVLFRRRLILLMSSISLQGLAV